ncbi:MAG: hypothetical protein AAGI66_03110 [Cyanobacteria bacterium P01_H01_bin.74]
MSFSEAFKIFQLNILRQSGVAIRPEQVGLKRDPIAELQAQGINQPFNAVLGNTINNLTPPVPPVPPTDLNDSQAQQQYQQDVLTYQNNFQIYHQRVIQTMMQQFQQMQRSIAEASRSAGTSSAEAGASESSAVGGIL